MKSHGTAYLAWQQQTVKLDVAFLEFSDPDEARIAEAQLNGLVNSKLAPLRLQVFLFLY